MKNAFIIRIILVILFSIIAAVYFALFIYTIFKH